MSAPTITRPRPPSRSNPSNQNRQPVAKRRGRRIFRRLLIASFLLILGATVAGIALFSWAWGTMDLPPEEPLIQTSYMTDVNGDRLATLATAENRTSVDLADVPLVVRQAVLDTEDRDFYTHRGLDPRGIARALVNDVRGESLQGGSTLTQQYVKLEYAGTDRTLERKVREAILAMKLEQQLTKDEIFERYLNAIYLGRGTYGVQAASQAYFGKNVGDLQLPEAAYIAGLIRGPEAADAYNQPEEALQRRNLTLGNMARFGDITNEERDATAAIAMQSYIRPREAAEPQVVQADKGTQYFVDYVRNILIQKYGEQLVTSGGLRVQTTLDPTLQAEAYDSVYGFLKEGEPAGALVSVDNQGHIKAMVGGRDYGTSQVNLATGALGGGSGRQAGSTYKPLELAAALESGVSIDERFPGPAQMNVRGWGATGNLVTNFGNENFGNINLTEATVHSVNTVYAQLVVENGVEGLIDMSKKVGIDGNLQPNNSLVLGTADVSPLEMAEAYMTFGNRGLHVASTPILEVTLANGDVLERNVAEGTQVMSQRTADTVNGVLQQVVQRGTGTAAGIGKPLAGKTGTTENNGDAWFVGYTPTLSTAVWMGYPEGAQKQMSNVRGIAVTGGTFPARIFSSYMQKATVDVDATAFATTTTTAPPTTVAPSTTSTIPSNQPLVTLPDDGSTNRGRGNGNGQLRELSAGKEPIDSASATTTPPRQTTTTTQVTPRRGPPETIVTPVTALQEE